MSTTILLITLLLALCIVVFAVALIMLMVPRAISARRLRRRARHDYRIARGTQHLQQLEGPLSALESEIADTQDQIELAEFVLKDLAGKRADESRKVLCRHLVTHRLTEVHGIGPRLQQRILSQCFRDDLRDLRHAERLFNIGPTRQAALMQWVRARERELPRLMAGAFPGKKEITERYAAKIEPVERRLERAQALLTEQRALLAATETTVDRLRSVQAPDFRKALKDGVANVHVPDWYLTGVYAPWESPPDWFTTLLDRYGG